MRRIVYYLHCLFALSLACLSTGANGQSANGQHVIYLKSGLVIPPPNAGAWIDSTINIKEKLQVLIHFTTIPDDAQKEALQRHGVYLGEYMPDNTYSAIVQPPLDKEVILSYPIYGFVNTLPEWKVGKYIWDEVARGSNETEVLVTFSRSIDVEVIRQFVTTIGGKIKNGKLEKYGSYNIAINAARIPSMAQWFGVLHISPVTEIAPLDVKSRPVVKGNVAVGSPVYGGYGLTGDSVTVGVGDDASGIYHADISDRIRNYNPAEKSSHGSHVNGIVAGAGNVDPFAVGMAPRASLIDFFYSTVLPATGTMYSLYNMTLTNNSYTIMASNCAYHGTYDAYSNFLDTLALQYPYVLHVFASGNDGLNTCPPYPQGFGTIGGGYQPAKNIVVVGSVLDGMLQAPDESRGPMKDGRIKPEITAVGVIAYSTFPDDRYGWAAGTSMASPQVAGGLALLTQRYKQLHAGAQPLGDLLKTILLNGAMDYGNPGPDYSYGFGIMDLDRSLKMLDNDHYYANAMANGDSQSVSIAVPPNTAQIKVMLCWNDVPANPASSKQLVNDLDIKVIGPAGDVRLPMCLDPSPLNVANLATEKQDHLNNVEQVTINNPVAGTYTIWVKGHTVPRGPQRYVVAYDLIPRGIHLTHPIGGEQVSNKTDPVDTFRVFWDAVSDGNTFTVEFSQNDGGNWTTISNNVPPHIRYCGFLAGGVNSGKCRVRISRNGTSETVTSGRFSINEQPGVSLDTAQCPGYVNIHWSPIPNATSYNLLSKVGKYMQVIGSVADTSYSFSNMSLTAKSYVAVQPVIDGVPGYRSVAAITIANVGNCTMPVSNGDLMVEKLVSANAGRQYTASAFGAGSAVKVRIRNMYTVPCNNYTLAYQVNGGAWQTLLTPAVIPANGTVDIDLVGASIAPVGTYNFIVAVKNLAVGDPQVRNDTLAFTVTSLANDTVSLTAPFVDGFEDMGVIEVRGDSMGLSPNAHWDFYSIDEFGRMRSYVDNDVSISGARSVSLDESQDVPSGSRNTFVGTFNLANYDTANTEVRMDFDYVMHGVPKSPDGNLVSVRAYDTLPWSPVHYYDLSRYPGIVMNVKSLSLTDAVRLSGRNFSTACQVSFGQSDTSLIAERAYGNGMTIDNFRMYTVTNDISLSGIVSPLPTNCGLTSSQPLMVKVRNGVNYTLHNVQLFYTLDGGATYTGTIDSISAKTEVVFTFAQPVSMTGGATHSLSVWANVSGDSYTANDSILNYSFRNSPIISSFPYLENFEHGDGGYYSVGFNSSWEYGAPLTALVNKAASGDKVWKTNLDGFYNNLELSYLYSPCYDISGLADPMLSFSAAMDIENCGGTLCDAAYVECSFDGNTWIKLGSVGQGTNWYDSTFNLWNTERFTRWHVASVSLPNPGPGSSIRFRFVLSTDPAVVGDGIAIDDIHIFDRKKLILPAVNTSTVTNNLGGNDWNEYALANQLLASVQPGNQNANGAAITLFHHDTLHNPSATQYTMPRSYVIKAAQQVDSMGVRLYLTEDDVVQVVADTLCKSCPKLPDAYSLGITQYTNSSNISLENGTLADDTGGIFTYHPYKKIRWVPYDNGYYAEFKAKPFSEYWFNNGGPTGSFPAGLDYLSFSAYRSGTFAILSWYSRLDSFVNVYTPEWSIDSINFATILDTPALHRAEAAYTIRDYVNFTKYADFWFRVKWTMTGKPGVYYSPVRKVSRGDSAGAQIAFNAKMISHSEVLLSWKSGIDVSVKHYVLERAVGSGEYMRLDNVISLKSFDKEYAYIDKPQLGMQTGILIHYRLSVLLEDGLLITLPEKTIEWVNMNAVSSVYPNPTPDGTININWQADEGSVLQLVISDITGKKVYEANAIATQWDNTTTLQTFKGPKGIYLLSAYISGRRYIFKVVYQ